MKNTSIQHVILGKLQFDHERESWKGQIEISPQKSLTFSILTDGYDEALVFELAGKMLTHIIENEKNLRLHTADELLDLHNETWNEGELINRDEFAERISLDGALFFHDGSAQLFYNDDDLFWGHTIVVNLDEKGNLDDTNLYG